MGFGVMGLIAAQGAAPEKAELALALEQRALWTLGLGCVLAIAFRVFRRWTNGVYEMDAESSAAAPPLLLRLLRRLPLRTFWGNCFAMGGVGNAHWEECPLLLNPLKKAARAASFGV